MDEIALANEAPLSWARYCSDAKVAGPFENCILYAMCRDYPRHEDTYVTAGKVTAIGRVYAAAPERGAGRGISPGSLAETIAKRLAVSALDQTVDSIGFADRFSQQLVGKVVEAHQLLVGEVAAATREWSEKGADAAWFPRNQASFASKYLHFHRPNAFPIMDRFAKAGLACAGIHGALDAYERFCEGILQYLVDQEPGWTPRRIDMLLVAQGRIHSDRTQSRCRQCNTEFVKRPRKKKPTSAT
jgi:hypothetical protein